jgi:uncharacterized protein YdaU (DUF1376 family)
MAKKTKPAVWMPFYTSDYLVATTHLNTEQHGAYMLLIMAAWHNGGTITSDEEHLQAITKLSPEQWIKSNKTLQKFFSISRDYWTHGRVKEEFDKASVLIDAKSKAGRVGAKSRWEKRTVSEEESMQLTNKLLGQINEKV